MAQSFPDIDDSYFVNRYLTQTIEDYKEVIKLLRANNSINTDIVDKLEKGVVEISTVSSNVSKYDDLSTQQKDALTQIIRQTNGIQKIYGRVIKAGQYNTDQYKEARGVWFSLYRSAKDIQMLNGTLKKDEKSLRPTGLSGAIGNNAMNQAHQSNIKEYRENNAIKDKVQQLNQQQIYPPAPRPPNTMRKRPEAETEGNSFWAEKGIQIVTQVFKGTEAFIKGLASFVSNLGKAYAQMMSAFGEILDSPLEQSVGMMSGMAQMISQGYAMIATLFGAIAEAISGILEVFTGSGDEDGNPSSKVSALVSSIVGVITALFEMAVQAIEAGFNIFISTLQAVFKIVKKIQETSPIIRQILDLLSLAFNLFFMPFMNQFALSILDSVVKLLEWAIEAGNIFQEKGAQLAELLDQQGINIDEILSFVETIAEEFVEKYLPQILQLIPSIVDFAKDFVNEILSNKDDLIGFIEQGLKAFKQLIDAGILPTFLDLGKKVMTWINDNADTIVTFIQKVLNASLNIANWFMGFFKTEPSEIVKARNVNVATLISDTVTDAILGSEVEEPMTDAEIDSAILGSIPAQASGGIFHHTYNGGIPVLTGEANESEYRLSEKELKEIGKDTTVVVHYNGSIMSTGDFKQLVRTTVSDVSNKSYFR